MVSQQEIDTMSAGMTSRSTSKLEQVERGLLAVALVVGVIWALLAGSSELSPLPPGGGEAQDSVSSSAPASQVSLAAR